jgi:hypothetical protein
LGTSYKSLPQFESRYLKADPDLRRKDGKGYREVSATIKEVVKAEEVAPQESDPNKRFKPVIYFNETRKGLIAGSKAIMEGIEKATETDILEEWAGKKVTLWVFEGQRGPSGQDRKSVV